MATKCDVENPSFYKNKDNENLDRELERIDVSHSNAAIL